MICEKCNFDYRSQPYCTSSSCLTKEVIEVKRDARGGFLTYIEGYRHPLRAYPQDMELHLVDVLKRVLLETMRLVVKMPVTPRRLGEAASVWMGRIYVSAFRVGQQKPIGDYSQSSREIIRVLEKTNPFTSDGWIWYLAMIWETDMAYRMTGQDMLQMLDKASLARDPRGEMSRILDACMEREKGTLQDRYVLQKTRMFRRLIGLAWHVPFYRRLMTSFLTEIEVDEVKLDLYDRYWLANKFDYNYEGKTYEERMRWRDEQDREWERPAIAPEIPRIAINPPNKAFYALGRRDAEKMADDTARKLMENWAQNQK